jgi:hypothetical protein
MSRQAHEADGPWLFQGRNHCYLHCSETQDSVEPDCGVVSGTMKLMTLGAVRLHCRSHAPSDENTYSIKSNLVRTRPEHSLLVVVPEDDRVLG